MNERGKKLEPKLSLDMPFSEALARYLRVKPAEINEAVEKSKSKGTGKRDGAMQSDQLYWRPRILSADYEAFRAILKDELPARYDDWLKTYSDSVEHFRRLGKVIEVDVNPDKFRAFCLSESIPYDLNSLSKFSRHISKTK
jgi:hypothetical protein